MTLQASLICSHRETAAASRRDRRRLARKRSSPSPSLVDELPIPRFFEREGGPYITAGAIVAKDRVSGHTNLSIARLMPLGGNRAFVGIAPNHHLAVLARAAHARGEKLDIAVCIGNHPAVLVAACLYLGLGRGRASDRRCACWASRWRWSAARSRICSCRPIANACWKERSMPASLSTEGPVSEFHGMYENYGRRHRCDVLPSDAAPRRHLSGGAAGISSRALPARRRRDRGRAVPRRPQCRAVGARRSLSVLAAPAVCMRSSSLRAPRPGEARKAMFAVWAAVNLIKQVIVVDDDIDPWNTPAGRVGERDAGEAGSRFCRSFPACVPIAPSRSNKVARSQSSASMPRAGRKTGRTGNWRGRRTGALHARPRNPSRKPACLGTTTENCTILFNGESHVETQLQGVGAQHQGSLEFRQHRRARSPR